MACPVCGTENVPDAVFCAKCGAQLQPMVTPVVAPPQARKKRLKWWYFPVSFMVLFLLLAVAAGMSNPGAPVLNHSLHFVTDMDVGGTSGYSPGPGMIVIEGNITNTGNVGGGGSIHFQVYTGYVTLEYDAGTGYVPAGGRIAFHWEQHYDNLNPLTATVKAGLIS